MLKETTLPDLLLAIGVLLLLFFVGRVIILWYYKIDERIALQKETNMLLQKLVDRSLENTQKPSARSINGVTIASPESTVNSPESTQQA